MTLSDLLCDLDARRLRRLRLQDADAYAIWSMLSAYGATNACVAALLRHDSVSAVITTLVAISAGVFAGQSRQSLKERL